MQFSTVSYVLATPLPLRKSPEISNKTFKTLTGQVAVSGVDMSGADAAVIGWEKLRARGLLPREDVAECGFPMPRWRAQFSARVQERITTL